MSNTDINFEELNQNILIEHNRLRTDPQSYIPILHKHLDYFKDKILTRPNDNSFQTNEGSSAVEEAIKFLELAKPTYALTFDLRLHTSAKDHILDIGSKGLLSHEGSDGKNVSDRIEKYCEWDGVCIENIEFGAKKAQDIIVSLLVDDGIGSRPHREIMFSNELKYIGVASGTHKDYGVATAIDYVSGIRDKNKPFYDYKNLKYDFPEELNKKQRKINNNFQIDDLDAPDKTVSVKIQKVEKEFEGKKFLVTKKIYELVDGSEQIVELEDFNEVK